MFLARSAGARILQRRPADTAINDRGEDVQKIDASRSLVVVEDIPEKWKKSQQWLSCYQVVTSSWIIEAISQFSLDAPIP
jgi:hypothetical protein